MVSYYMYVCVKVNISVVMYIYVYTIVYHRRIMSIKSSTKIKRRPILLERLYSSKMENVELFKNFRVEEIIQWVGTCLVYD